MSKVDIEIISLIEKIRRRLFAIKAMNSVLVALSAALAGGVLLAVLSRFIPIYDVYIKALYLIIPAFCAGIIYTFFKAPSRSKAALLADSCGLKERTITALELVGNDSAIADIQKHDAVQHLRRLDIKSIVPMRVNIRYITVFLILVTALALTAFIPNPMEEKAEDMHKQKVKISEVQKKVDNIVEKINKNPKLSSEQKKEIEKKLRELKKDLSTTQNEKELNKTIQKWDKKIELIKKEYVNDELDKIADTLSKNEMTKELSTIIRNRDTASMKKDLEKFAKELQTMTPSKLKALAEEYSKLAEALKKNPALKRAFSDLARKIDAGEMGNLQRELDAVAKGLEDLMYDPELQDALTQVSKELNEMQSDELRDQKGSQGQSGNGNNSGENGHRGNGSGNNQQGQNGAGAGTGTDKGQENQNPTNPSGGIGQKGQSEGKTGEYEKVFTPETIGGEGEISSIGGKKGSGGSSEQVITDKSPSVRGESIPYNQVIGEYKQNAIESINNSDIPQGMKELVKNYFKTLEE